MSKWTIDKSFSFEMGHRVWAQKLNTPEFSISTECACKHLHGHSYELKVFLSGKELDKSHMVTDFKNLNWIKEFLDSNLDHRFMIDINDPNFEFITGIPKLELIDDIKDFSLLKRSHTADVWTKEFQLHIDSFVLVNFCPTSEKICEMLAKKFQLEMKKIADVTAVELWETKKSHCRYEL